MKEAYQKMTHLGTRLWQKYNEDGPGRLLVDYTWHTNNISQRVFKITHPILYRMVQGYYQRRWLKERDIGAFAQPPNPTKIVWISPKRITYRTRRPEPISVNKPSYIGRVKGGSWDKSERRFDQSKIFHSVRQRYIHGMEWEETKVVRERVPPWDLNTIEEIQRKGEGMDQLWESLHEEGYQTQRELWKYNPKHYRKKFFPDLLTNEITVDIGRNGEFLFVDSFHRLSMAKIMGLESVPVCILVRHREWMNYWNSISEKDEIPDHPDLHELRSTSREGN